VKTERFWDEIYTQNPTHIPNESDPMLVTAISYFGNISGARVLDLGCGNGSSSLFFAKRGANVVSLDISEVAISSLKKFCTENQINNITPIQCSAFDIAELEPFDFVFGNMILHHLEPFESFAQVLRKSIVPGGKAYFRENSAFSDLLIWFRNNLLGKYGIPKYGDDEEFPLMPKEVEILKKYFSVKIVYPELLFFRLVSLYLLQGKLHNFTNKLDDYFFKVPGFRKYSYRQNLFLSWLLSETQEIITDKI
jgi:SAM-dependent methyltransferase